METETTETWTLTYDDGDLCRVIDHQGTTVALGEDEAAVLERARRSAKYRGLDVTIQEGR